MLNKADVVVIGGGISGCAIAYNLAKRGKKAVLLEKDDLAFEASGRTVAAVGLLGKQAGEFGLARESLALYDKLSDEIDYDIEFIKGGRILLAEDPEDKVYFDEMVDHAETAGVELTVLDKQEVARRFPFIEGPFISLAYSPQEGHVNPVRVVQGFAQAARENGAEIYTNCLATNVLVSNGKVSGVETAKGIIQTSKVVNAAGVWAYRLADRLGIHIPIQIVRLAQGETQPTEPVFQPFIRSGAYCTRQMASGVARVSNGYRDQAVFHDLSLHDIRDIRVWLPRLIQQRKTVSFRVDTNYLGHEIKGAIASLRNGDHPHVAPTGIEARPALHKVQAQLDRVKRLVPRLKDASIVNHWAGLIDLTPDLLPVLGPVARPHGFYLAMGFSGHGFAFGPVVGKALAELIVEGRTSTGLHPFRPTRFAEGTVKMPRRIM